MRSPGVGEGERILVSSQEVLDKLHEESFEQWSRICTLDDAAQDEPEDGVAHRLSGLHAKILAFEHGWNVTWYLGSANMTAAAFTGRNVEVMASMTARKGRKGGNAGRGIDRFLESGFDKLCTPYRRSDTETENSDVVEALQRLEATRDALLDADLKVICLPSGEDWTWRLEGAATLPPGDVGVATWPISVAEEHAQPLTLPVTWTLPIQRLTCLVAFRLHVPVKTVDDIAFALRLPVDGMPVDRMHHVLRTLIGDPERFLAFLRALLGGLEGMVDWPRSRAGDEGGGPWTFGPGNETLLEDLVRTASRDPAHLEPVRRLIDDFKKTEEGSRIIPGDFLEIWTAVNEALRDEVRQ